MLYIGSWYNGYKDESFASTIEYQGVVMKGVANPLHIAQCINLLDYHMFPRVMGPYGFV